MCTAANSQERNTAACGYRSTSGDIKSFPVTQTLHTDSILSLTETPADVPSDVAEAARELARDAVSCLSGAGIFGCACANLYPNHHPCVAVSWFYVRVQKLPACILPAGL